MRKTRQTLPTRHTSARTRREFIGLFSTSAVPTALRSQREVLIAQGFAPMREYLNEMYLSSAALKFACLCLAWVTLSSCAGGRTAGEHIADMPYWMGGLPADGPPRPGTPETEE